MLCNFLLVLVLVLLFPLLLYLLQDLLLPVCHRCRAATAAGSAGRLPVSRRDLAVLTRLLVLLLLLLLQSARFYAYNVSIWQPRALLGCFCRRLRLQLRLRLRRRYNDSLLSRGGQVKVDLLV